MNAVTVAPAPHAAPPASGPRHTLLRRVFTWAGIVAALLVFAVIALSIAGDSWSQRRPFDPEGAGPSGALALTRILAENGVAVVVADNRDDALRALREAEGPTTLVALDTAYLSDEGLDRLFAAASDVVLPDPRARDIELLLPGISSGGFGPRSTVSPQCDLADATRSGAIVAGRLFDASGVADASACYLVDGSAGLVVAPHGDGRAAVIDGSDLFVNEHLAEDGNAGLALNLLGRHATLVWYAGSPADSDLATTNPSLGELTPAWVTPALVLLALAAIGAAVWRGRRFGALVFERMPVVVRASETTEGRAQLYARGRDHLHAADSLRLGTIDRLARALGLGSSADVPRIAGAVADLIGADRGRLLDLLVNHVPRSDAELLALSDRLRDLETAVRSAIRDQGRPS